MAQIKAVDPAAPKPKRSAGGTKSATQYPYFDLDDSIDVAGAVQNQGGGTCSRDQLAAFLGYKTTRSGTFLTRIYAAKLFGLVSFSGEKVSVTELAKQILAPVLPEDEVAGRIAAFIAVPLFSKVYERFKGGALPLEVGLENLLKGEHGIIAERVKPALRVMLKSAEQAGFFKTTGNKSRMIMPLVSAYVQPTLKSDPSPDSKSLPDNAPEVMRVSGGGGDGPPPGIHTALLGMMRELPKPGTPWPKGRKDRFIAAFRGILDVVYPDPEDSP